MRALLFAKQQLLGSVPWTDFGRDVGVADMTQFESCVDDARPLQKIENGKKLAEKMNVRGTPTIIVNGWRLPFMPSPEDFGEILESVADGKSPNEAINSLVANAQS